MNTQLLGNFFPFLFAVCCFTFLLPWVLISFVLIQVYSKDILISEPLCAFLYGPKLYFVIAQGIIQILHSGIYQWTIILKQIKIGTSFLKLPYFVLCHLLLVQVLVLLNRKSLCFFLPYQRWIQWVKGKPSCFSAWRGSGEPSRDVQRIKASRLRRTHSGVGVMVTPSLWLVLGSSLKEPDWL